MSSSDIDKPLPNDIPNATMSIRMIMTGKEVGSIIGKGGEIISSIREESGAKIYIADGSGPERIVTVTGSTDAILKSFNLIAKKFEDDGPYKLGESSGKSSSASTSSKMNLGVSFKLVVPASQCGSLIGKGGSKIKEIREVTGASVQVATDLLPNSTERLVTISGARDCITQSIYQICCVMLKSPPRGTTIPYNPKGGLLSSGGRGSRIGNQPDNPLASLLTLGGASTLAAIASLAGSQIRDNRSRDRDREDHGGSSGSGGSGSGGSSSSFEIYVPNDMIGCIIGKGGSKIAEIRQISGAMIRISKSEDASGDSERESSSERQISITGNPDSVALAKSLINMSLDLHKSKMEDNDQRDRPSTERSSRGGSDRNYGGGGGGGGGGNNSADNIGLAAQLLAKPEALSTALTTLASLSSLGTLASGLLPGLTGSGSGSGSGHVSGVHRRSGGGYGGGSRSSRDDDRSRDSKRSKFAPY